MIQPRALEPSPELCCLPTPHRISYHVAGMAFNFSKLEMSDCVVHGAGGFRVERKGELLVPIEGVAGMRDGVIAVAGARTMACDVSCVGSDLVRDDAVLDVLLVGQAEVLLRRDVAEHGRAVPADHGRADGGSDVVVAGGDVGDE